MQIIYFDTETTGLEPDARLVQLAYKSAKTGEVVSEYFRPPKPISYGSMAVHHITEEMVVDKPAFQGSTAHSRLVELLSDHIAVAHNAPFDIQILSNEDVRIERNIDTLRLARHLVDSEQYSMQYLRYFLGLNTEGTAHDAHGDVLVLESLFNHLYALVQEKFELTNEEEILEKMLELTKTPVLLKTFGFGKHIGRTFQEVSENDRSYLEWLHGSESQKNMYDQNEDLVHTLKYYLN